MKRLMSEVSGSKGKFTVKVSPIMQNRQLYKNLLEEFNEKTYKMQQKSRDLNKLFKKLILDLDASVTETEFIFQDEIKNLILEQQVLSKKYYFS